MVVTPVQGGVEKVCDDEGRKVNVSDSVKRDIWVKLEQPTD